MWHVSSDCENSSPIYTRRPNSLHKVTKIVRLHRLSESPSETLFQSGYHMHLPRDLSPSLRRAPRAIAKEKLKKKAPKISHLRERSQGGGAGCLLSNRPLSPTHPTWSVSLAPTNLEISLGICSAVKSWYRCAFICDSESMCVSGDVSTAVVLGYFLFRRCRWRWWLGDNFGRWRTGLPTCCDPF